MSGRIQVNPYCQFGGDTSWITQEIIEGYIFAMFKGARYGEAHLAKHAQSDPARMRLFRNVIMDDPDFDDLQAQLWEEMGYPEKGTIEYHVMMIERLLEDPATPPTELAKLYKVLGEFRGWIAKPGEAKQTVNINGPRLDYASMNETELNRVYASVVAGRG